MPYYYDQLHRIAVKEGKTFTQVSEEAGIPRSTSEKWSKREPHKKYKHRLDAFFKEHPIDVPESNEESAQETIPSQSDIPIDYDEYGIPVHFWESLKEVYLTHSKDGTTNWNNEQTQLKKPSPQS